MTETARSAVALLAVARISDSAVLARHLDKASNAAEERAFSDAVAQVTQRAGTVPAYAHWRDHVAVGDKLDDHNGHVYALADQQALVLAVVAVRGQKFPERVAQTLLRNVIEKVRSQVPDEELSEAKAGKLSGALKSTLKELALEYSDLAKVDKTAEVHEKVDQVKGLMQDNVKQILETHASLESLQHKSSSMTDSADRFLKQSTSLRRQIQLRNLRIQLAVGGCAAALVLYFVLPLVMD